jgi:hypothetical protein
MDLGTANGDQTCHPRLGKPPKCSSTNFYLVMSSFIFLNSYLFFRVGSLPYTEAKPGQE